MVRIQQPNTTTANEPVAVVGMACRLPGADSPAQLWELLDAETCTVTEVPRDRFDIDAWHDQQPRPGAITSRRGGFVDGVRDFDARFFGMSGREAVRTDPRQRLLMETGWEAVADAGWPAERVAGSRLGVWVSGCMVSEYWDLLRESADPDLHAVFGAGMFGAAPGRLSHLLDARGPSVAVDATCAGGLVALHQAMASLRAGEADTALVAGVNLLLGPDNSAALSSGGVLSKEGLCRFGDTRASGYVRSEGVVAVVLKPLSRAVADGDRVRAVVLGSATSHDGRSAASQMSPSVDGQEIALRAAYRDAGVDPREVGYVEAHGTGTTIGDRVELTALSRVLGAGREAGDACAVGSVKSNVGHTEAAAGLAGLAKVVLALEHGRIPASLHIEEANPAFTGSGLEPARTARAWPGDRRAVAGISSFGLSGANAHAVVAAAPAPALKTVVTGTDAGRPVLVPLSAASRPAVAALADQWAELAADPVDLAHTAALHRTHHPVRSAALVGTRAEAGEALRAAVANATEAGPAPKVVFVFPGQGAQWAGMARDLLDSSTVFARTMAECDAAVRHELGWSVVERLRAGEELVTVDVVQPCLWAVAVGLAAVWRDWGVEPELVIGHSMGEVAAATVTGALSIRDGAAVTCRRARLLAGLDDGAMALVQLGQDEVAEAVGQYADRVTISAFNSSYSSVIAGDDESVSRVLAELTAGGVFCRRIAVTFASHSRHVEPVLAPLRAELAGLRPAAGAVPMHSTLLDEPVDGSGCDADYWADNLREPVRFASAVRAALDEDRPTLFVEMSPHPTMVGAIEDEIDAAGGTGGAVGSLHRAEPWTVLMQAAGVAYGRGCTLLWERINPAGRYLPLPAYPWQRETYWPSAPAEVAQAPEKVPVTNDVVAPAEGTVVGTAVQVEPAAEQLTVDLSCAAGGHLAAVAEAVAALAPGRDALLEQVREHGGPAEGPVRLELRPTGAGEWSFDVRRGEQGPAGFVRWTALASGRCRTVARSGGAPVEIDTVRAWCTDVGRQGPLVGVWRRDGEAVARLAPGTSLGAAVVATVRAALPSPVDGLRVAALDELRVRQGTPTWCLARLHGAGSGGEVAGDVRLLDEDGALLAELRGVVLRAGPAAAEPVATPVKSAPVASSPIPRVVIRPPAMPASPLVASLPPTTATAAPPAEAHLEAQLTAAIALVLQTPQDQLDPDTPLGRLGLDSLLAAEVRTAMRRDHQVDVPTRMLLGGSGVATIVRKLQRRTTQAVPAASVRRSA